MWSHLLLAGTILLLMSSCGSSKSIPVTQGNSTQAAPQQTSATSPLQQLHRQAKKGNPEAQFALGQAYDRGREVPLDQAEVVRWYRRAAEQSDTFSQFFLGNKYWEGSGISKNEQEAIRWWHKAAAQGFAPAQNSLGQALATGSKTLGQDKVQAYMWLALSAKQGDQEADQQRAILAKQLKKDQIEKAKLLIKQWKPQRAGVTIKQ